MLERLASRPIAAVLGRADAASSRVVTPAARRYRPRPVRSPTAPGNPRLDAPSLARIVAISAGMAMALSAWADDPVPGATPGATPAATPAKSPAGRDAKAEAPPPKGAPDQGVEVASPYEGRPISAVRFEGLKRVKEPFLQNQVRTVQGRPLEWATVREDCRRLQRLGEFRGIEAKVEVGADLSVAVVFVVTEAPVVKDVQVVGNREVPDEDIARVTGDVVALIRGVPIDDYRVGQGQRAIENLYREKGYYQVRVTLDESQLENDGIIQYVVREGEKTRVTVIRFEGNKAFPAKQLRPELKTEEANWFVTAPLDDEVLDRDVAAIVKFYQDRGYLDVRASRRIQPAPNSKEAIVTFVVDEGALYSMRSISVQGKQNSEQAPAPLKVFTQEQLLGLVELKPGGVFGRKDADQAIETIKGAYHKLGYVDVQVVSEELRVDEPPGTHQIDMRVYVREGERFKTGLVIVEGNTLTQNKVVRREVTVKPDRWLDATETADTEKRLRESRLFETNPANGAPPKVTIQPASPDAPGYRDVLVDVTETDTGSLNFGAAVSSDANVFGVINLNQRNFDLADTPDSFSEFISGKAFRGAGQNFQLSLQPGIKQSQYLLTIGEPAFLETPYAVSNTVSFTQREFREYDEERLGDRLRIGRRFGTRWVGSVTLRAQTINISGIDRKSPVDVFDVQGDNLLTSLGFDLTRTTVDSRFHPTEGTRTELGFEQVGALGGDFNYSKVTAEHSVFISIDEDYLGRKTVLSLSTRAGYIFPQDESPIFERFFLGGRNFRGFRFRGIGPLGVRHDNGQVGDEHVGGDFSFTFGPEIEKPLFQDIVSGVAFIDSGTLNQDASFKDYRVSAGLGLRLYIPAFGQAPLAFDFAVPVRDFDGDRKQFFSFALDIPF